MKLQVAKSVWEGLEGIIEIEDISKILKIVAERTGTDVTEILVLCESNRDGSLKVNLSRDDEQLAELREV
jgi:hypothetical protein